MPSATAPTTVPAIHSKLNRSPGKLGMLGFGIVLLVGVSYSAYHLLSDLSAVHSGSIMPYCSWALRCWSRWASSL